MGKIFSYRQALLPCKPGVDKQRLVVTVNGTEQEPIVVAPDATEIIFKAGPEGATVDLDLDYLDAAGNDSDNAEHSFTVVDTIAPSAPDGFGSLTQISEEEEPVP